MSIVGLVGFGGTMAAQRKTLVKSFTVMIFLILVVGQGILYTWLLLYQKSHLGKSLRADMTSIAQFAADPFLVQEGDQLSVERLLDAYLKTGNILSVEITSSDGIKLTAKTAGTAGQNNNRKGSVLDALGLFMIPL